MKSSHVVLLLALLLFVCNVWGYDLWTPDEPFFGEGAREMLADGHWLVSFVNGKLNTHKPPLFFWLIALLSLPVGRVTSLTARLPSALASLSTVALVLRLGRRFASERTAVLGALVLATTYMFWDKARSAQIDALLCCLIWVALSAFEAYRAGDANGRRAGWLFWAAAALAVLAKGPVGLLLPLGIALLTLAVDRDLRRWRGFAPLSGPLVFVLLCGSWVVATMLWGPPEYSVWAALEEHFVERGIHGMHHVQPWWYYATVLPPQLLPWSFLVPGALVLAWRRRDPADRFLLVTVIYVVLFFSISTEKRTLYVLPAYPAFALLVARFAGALLGWEGAAPALSRRWITVSQGLCGGLATLLGLAVPFAVKRVEEISGWVVWSLAVVLVVSGIATLWAVARTRLLATTLLPASGFVVVYLIAAVGIFPMMNDTKSGREFTRVLVAATAESRAAGYPVLALDMGNLPIQFAFFSSGLYTVETGQVEDVVRHFAAEDRVFAAVNGDRLDELPASLRQRMEVIATTHANRRDVVLLANRPAGGGPSDAALR